ncbi:PAS domain S-box protein [Bradyrhizobium sp. CB82]|uniref:hybrid sensor histidine kinase/response regulator n=1 Tax=Bradyrhizobium sp. CB82 TaxID=3039159 RepID=UPI0024B28078|nr:PAS domain S-box protein [Bradyrhizobium sp. CB82]WFU39115.1 PAS domain S-box protein [Bradyrhizobium sp. CB82]
MTSPLRILLLEDNSTDAELIQDLLETDGLFFEITRVQTRVEFEGALNNVAIDLILADYQLPSFDGLSALNLALRTHPNLPFIFVSGTLGEEVAVEALKIGATDYVLKTSLSRLVPSMRRALREAGQRTERRKAEEALRRSEMTLAEAQRLSHTGSFGWDVLSGEINWSDETCRIFGCAPGTKPTTDLVVERTHPDDRMLLRKMIDRTSIVRAAFTTERRLMMPDGVIKHVRVVAHPAASDNPESVLFIGAITDITSRKRAEETLQEQANLLNLTHDAIFVHDLNEIITYWNRGAEKLYGWTGEQAKGQNAFNLLKPAFPAPLEEITSELLQTGHWEGEVVHTRKDHARLTVESRWSLQRDAQGTPVAVLVTNSDIGDRKLAERERERLRQLEADLARINRVSMMGELAASLAHEIKQPITAAALKAQACGRWLSHAMPDVTRAREVAGEMITDVMRAGAIIDRVRSLYARSAPQWELIDINEIIREMTALLRDLAIRNAVSIRTELAVGIPSTTADRVQVQQVLMNLMINGIEAMKDSGGELTVVSDRTEDHQLLISVSDSGIGLPANECEHIFDAFFTTKPQGAGMGLSISRRIIESHGGRLWASPNSGRGATFRFTLPGKAMQSSRHAV